MTTAPNSAILEPVTNPVLTVAPQNKEDTTMSGATNKITALWTDARKTVILKNYYFTASV